jgi:hypothetical protein
MARAHLVQAAVLVGEPEEVRHAREYIAAMGRSHKAIKGTLTLH